MYHFENEIFLIIYYIIFLILKSLKEKNWAFKKKSLGSSMPLVQFFFFFFLKMTQGPNAPSLKTFEIFSLFLGRFGNFDFFIYLFFGYIHSITKCNKQAYRRKRKNATSIAWTLLIRKTNKL